MYYRHGFVSTRRDLIYNCNTDYGTADERLYYYINTQFLFIKINLGQEKNIRCLNNHLHYTTYLKKKIRIKINFRRTKIVLAHCANSPIIAPAEPPTVYYYCFD